ncbi:hypothetical protein GCM10022220_19630 [Actinocatenispora rupis]
MDGRRMRGEIQGGAGKAEVPVHTGVVCAGADNAPSVVLAPARADTPSVMTSGSGGGRRGRR